jgi:hypothetical protein
MHRVIYVFHVTCYLPVNDSLLLIVTLLDYMLYNTQDISDSIVIFSKAVKQTET